MGHSDEYSKEQSRKNLGNLLASKKRKERETKSKRIKQGQSLVKMQKELYNAITQSVLMELKEERIWIIDQVVISTFASQRMYPIVEKEDVPWRSWQNWLREWITAFCRQNGKLNIVPRPGYHDRVGSIGSNPIPQRQQPHPSMNSVNSLRTNPMTTYSMNQVHPVPVPVPMQPMVPRVSLQQIQQLQQQFPVQNPVAPQPIIPVSSESLLMPQYEEPVKQDEACRLQ